MTKKLHDELRVRCEECGHRWIAAYAPMDLAKFVAVLRGTHCPKCGAKSNRILIDS